MNSKVNRLFISFNGGDSEKLINKAIVSNKIAISDIISIQEFNASLYPYVVLWYKKDKEGGK